MALRAKLLQSYTMRLHLLLYPTIDLFTKKKQNETKKTRWNEVRLLKKLAGACYIYQVQMWQ